MKQSILVEWLPEVSENNKTEARMHFKTSGYWLSLNNTDHRGFSLINSEDKFDEITNNLNGTAVVYLIEATK